MQWPNHSDEVRMGQKETCVSLKKTNIQCINLSEASSFLKNNLSNPYIGSISYGGLQCPTGVSVF